MRTATDQLWQGFQSVGTLGGMILASPFVIAGAVFVGVLGVISGGYLPLKLGELFNLHRKDPSPSDEDEYISGRPYEATFSDRLCSLGYLLSCIVLIGFIGFAFKPTTAKEYFSIGLETIWGAIKFLGIIVGTPIMVGLGLASFGLIPALIARTMERGTILHDLSNLGFALSVLCGVGLIGYAILWAWDRYQEPKPWSDAYGDDTAPGPRYHTVDPQAETSSQSGAKPTQTQTPSEDPKTPTRTVLKFRPGLEDSDDETEQGPPPSGSSPKQS